MTHTTIATALSVFFLSMAASASAAPCITATAACTEWVTAGSAPVRTLVYRSFPLDARNADITRAVVMVHGAGRDADNYFLHTLAAAFLGAALDDTVVISPRFASNNGGCADALADRETNWECGGPARWTAGGEAKGAKVTSFDVIDEILRRLARRDSFPNLRTIIVAGHSAGGQFVSRYQMSNQVHETLSIPVSYIVANPSSYAYLDPMRPTATAFAEHLSALAPGYVSALPAKPVPPFAAFGDDDGCTGTTTGRTACSIASGIPRVSPTISFASSWPRGRRHTCSAAWTSCRYSASTIPARPWPRDRRGWPAGLPMRSNVNQRFGAKHEVKQVPACGHNARCMFTDAAALALLFPKR